MLMYPRSLFLAMLASAGAGGGKGGGEGVMPRIVIVTVHICDAADSSLRVVAGEIPLLCLVGSPRPLHHRIRDPATRLWLRRGGQFGIASLHRDHVHRLAVEAMLVGGYQHLVDAAPERIPTGLLRLGGEGGEGAALNVPEDEASAGIEPRAPLSVLHSVTEPLRLRHQIQQPGT